MSSVLETYFYDVLHSYILTVISGLIISQTNIQIQGYKLQFVALTTDASALQQYQGFSVQLEKMIISDDHDDCC